MNRRIECNNELINIWINFQGFSQLSTCVQLCFKIPSKFQFTSNYKKLQTMEETGKTTRGREQSEMDTRESEFKAFPVSLE